MSVIAKKEGRPRVPAPRGAGHMGVRLGSAKRIPLGPRRHAGLAVSYALLGLGGLVLVAPVAWVLMASFMPSPELAKYPPRLIPGAVTLNNYEQVFNLAPMLRYIINSVIVVGAITLCVAVTSLFAGYVFAVIDWPGRGIAFWCVLITLLTPFQVLVVPLFSIMKSFGWVNSYESLVVPFVVSAFGILLVRNYFAVVPKEYFDAARVDGLREWGIVWRVALPMVRPAISALVIFTFLGQWDNLLWPAIVVSSDSKYTLPLGITTLAKGYISSPNITVAAAVIALVPTVVVFLVFQRRFVEGAALSGLR